MAVLLKNRTQSVDQIGSRMISKIARFIYGHHKRLKAIHEPLIHNNIFELAFVELCDKYNLGITDNTENDEPLPFEFHDSDNLNMFSVQEIKQDLISYFRMHFLASYYEILKGLADKEEAYSMPWISRRTTCIHLRLGVVVGIQDTDGEKEAAFYRDKINNDEKIYTSLLGPRQMPIAQEKLIKALKITKLRYSKQEIVITTERNSFEKARLMYPQLARYHLFESEYPEYDIWKMMHSNVFIGAKSGMSNLVAFLHRGKEVYLPINGSTASLGLTSKYDQSDINCFA